jgi:hypothetical protein
MSKSNMVVWGLGLVILLTLGGGLWLHWGAGSFDDSPGPAEPGKEPRSSPGKSVTSLRRDLSDSRLEVRQEAAKGLANLGPEAEPATGELIAALKDRNRAVQGWAIKALVGIGPKIGLHALFPLVDDMADEDPGVRQRAIIVLVAMGKKVIPALEKALEADDTRVHQSALAALVQLGPEAVPTLIKDLKDAKNVNVRQRAAQALGAIGPPARSAQAALEEALGDSSERVRKEAAASLKKIDPQ